MSVDYEKDIVDSRFLHGGISFESALSEVVGVEITRDDLAEVLRGFLKERLAVARGPALSAHDEELLDAAGFTVDETAATVARVSSALRMRELVRTALTVSDAADLLGVSAARVRQRIAERTLWAFKNGRHQLLPAVQFTDTGTVPHLDKVAPLVPADLHPLGVQALFTRVFPDLTVDGQPASIVDFLAVSAGSATDIGLVADVIGAVDWESV